MITLITLALIILGVLTITLLLNYYPAFGAAQSESKIALFKKTDHYKAGHFINLIPTSLNMNFSKFSSIMKDYIRGVKNARPEKPLPVQIVDSLTLASKNDSTIRLTWFGHSAFLLEIDGRNILIDPMLGDVAAPFSWLGSKRFTDGLPIEIERLPAIDALIFSHDHYDHLDYGSIMKLKNKVEHFFVPLGVGSHLQAWGVDPQQISELNWWDRIEFKGLNFICTPARHFSGRAMFDRNTTLWASWIIKGTQYKIYFSGDSGYGPHFKTIGEKFGPFDFALMECGQYDKRWEDVHMLPEQTVQAAIDLKAKRIMPIHWGAFVLALHPWKEPVQRMSRKANERGQSYIIPQIGEQVYLFETQSVDNTWWVDLQ